MGKNKPFFPSISFYNKDFYCYAIITIKNFLYLFSEPCDWYPEHLAVLSNRAAGDAVALVVEDVHQLLVGQRASLILLSNALLKKIFNLVARDLLARNSLHSL